MTERIAQIRHEAEAAIAAAADTQALEEVRIRYLGRKAELPNLLRNVAQLPPEQRAATGKAANEAAPGARAGDRGTRRRTSPRPSSNSACRTTASTSRCRQTRSRRSAGCI